MNQWVLSAPPTHSRCPSVPNLDPAVISHMLQPTSAQSIALSIRARDELPQDRTRKQVSGPRHLPAAVLVTDCHHRLALAGDTHENGCVHRGSPNWKPATARRPKRAVMEGNPRLMVMLLVDRGRKRPCRKSSDSEGRLGYVAHF